MKPRRGGFSLVELMVSIVVGLLALMFATRLMVNAEQNKQTSLGGSDALQNGMLALFSIDRDAAQAGWGLNDPLLVGCVTNFSDLNGYALGAGGRLAAAVIQSNGAAPDQLTLYSGSSVSGTGTLRIYSNYPATSGNGRIDVDRVPYGFGANDVIVVAPETPGVNCSLAQIAADPGQAPSLSIAAGAGLRFNAGALGQAYSANQARLFNLGPVAALSFHTWSVQNAFLRLRATDLAGASAAPGALVIDNVVSLKAEYGLDTRSSAAFAAAPAMQIGAWSATMPDADGDGVAGGAGDYQRIAALRIAIVARSKSPEKPNAAGVCSTTPALPVVFGSAQPAGVAAVPLTVNVAVAGDAIAWNCYRYRVFETIVPLRNSGWKPQP